MSNRFRLQCIVELNRVAPFFFSNEFENVNWWIYHILVASYLFIYYFKEIVGDEDNFMLEQKCINYLIERAAQVLFNCEVHEIWICLDDEKTKGKIWPCNFARAHKRERINEGR